MNCNCLTTIKNELLEAIQSESTYKKTVINASLKEVDMVKTGSKMFSRTYTSIEIELDGQKKLEKSNLVHTYCPFCGVKQKDEGRVQS